MPAAILAVSRGRWNTAASGTASSTIHHPHACPNCGRLIAKRAGKLLVHLRHDGRLKKEREICTGSGKKVPNA
jgi:hypothetical protein